MQLRARLTKAKIVSSAANSFDLRGYAGTTFDILLIATGMTKGAIYYHFASKEKVADQLIEEWSAYLAQWHIDASQTRLPAIEQIVRIFGNFADRAAADTEVRAATKMALEPSLATATRAFSDWVDAVADLVVTAIKVGDIADTPAAHRLAKNLCASTIGLTQASTPADAGFTLKVRIDDMVSSYLAAVTPDGVVNSDRS